MKTARIAIESLTRQQVEEIRMECEKSDFFSLDNDTLSDAEYSSIIQEQDDLESLVLDHDEYADMIGDWARKYPIR